MSRRLPWIALMLCIAGLAGAAEPKEAAMILARSSNTFGLDLYHRLSSKAGNLAVSPASITTALAMTWGGARGETAAQMKQVMHFDGGQAELLATSGKLAQSLEDPARGVTLRIANRLFGEASYHFEVAYLDAVKAAFGAPLETVDFRKKAEAARLRINGWVEEKTEKRIVALIPPRGVDDQTRLVLVNAIYFLGDWASPFTRSSTHDAAFHIRKDQKKDVPTMHQAGSFRLADVDAVTALELPYKGGQTSMLILLPRDVDGLAAVERSLDTARLEAIVAALKSGRVMVSLPRFEVSPAEPLSLGDDLQKLGMADAFDRGRADFTAIADPPSPAERLFIARVFHKAFVRVDEKGTEAAAATAVVMARAGSAPQKATEFNADHPFLFFIRDNSSGLVLFMGRVADPALK